MDSLSSTGLGLTESRSPLSRMAPITSQQQQPASRRPGLDRHNQQLIRHRRRSYPGTESTQDTPASSAGGGGGGVQYYASSAAASHLPRKRRRRLQRTADKRQPAAEYPRAQDINRWLQLQGILTQKNCYLNIHNICYCIFNQYLININNQYL